MFQFRRLTLPALLAALALLGPAAQAKPPATPPMTLGPEAPPVPVDERFVYLTESTNDSATRSQIYVSLPAKPGENGRIRVWVMIFHVFPPPPTGAAGRQPSRRDGLASYEDFDCAGRRTLMLAATRQFGPRGQSGISLPSFGDLQPVNAGTILERAMNLACQPGDAAERGLQGLDAAWEDALARARGPVPPDAMD